MQGMASSSWLFCLLLEYVFKRCDTDGGIDIGLATGKVLRLTMAEEPSLGLSERIKGGGEYTPWVRHDQDW
eukprot:COSAG01_NODE_13674_length_1550_cov_2.631978_1_plen_70_part_10